MRIHLVIALYLVCFTAQSETIYSPPKQSAKSVEGISFNGAPVGKKYQDRFSECDARNTCDGKPLKYKCTNDRNNNSTILKLKGNAIFYDGKMGLDADGSPYSKKRTGTDQPETSLRYNLPNNPSINADRVPFIVIPLGGFDEELGVKIGDVAAVVYGDKRVFAIVADQGPKCKIGEGSIELHELFGHKVCKSRTTNGDCVRLQDIGIDKNVLYFIFPGTRELIYDGMTPENINMRIQSVGEKFWSSLIQP